MRIVYLFISILFCTACQNQTKKESQENPYKNILILGNSIVAHDPAPEIGWNCDWGMAASARDKDFVHLLNDRFHAIDSNIHVVWQNISVYENNYETYDLTLLHNYRNADMIIIKISENVKYEPGMDVGFIESYNNLLHYLAPSDSVVKIIVEGFWPTPVNDMIRNYAKKNNYPFVPLADLFENDKSNAAIGLFEHEGVANHPSDKGMHNIASRIWEVVADYFK